HRLFDVNRVLRATLLYPLLTVVLGLCYVGIAFAISQLATSLLGPAASATTTAAVLAALAVALAAHPLRRRLQAALDQHISGERLARQRFVDEAAATLGRAQTPATVTAFLTDHAVERLQLTAAWLIRAGDTPAAPADDGAPGAMDAAAVLGQLASLPGP